VAENAENLDANEWNNIGQFLRLVYTTTNEDLRVVAKGIREPSNQERAAKDMDLLMKYSQAADGPVQQKDGAKFVAVADQMLVAINDFFDALVDVPDL